MNSIVDTEPTMSSSDLLEIVNQVRAEFGENSIRNNDFISRVKDELAGEAYEIFVSLKFGKESETIKLTADQCMLISMRESKAVRRKVLEKLKEKTSPSLVSLPQVEHLAPVLSAVEIAARILNVSESGKLHMVGTAMQRYGVDPSGLIPVYAIDSAPDVTSGSSMVTKSLSDLLKEFSIGFSARTINPLLEEAGIIRREYRTSSSGQQKGFWSITEDGLKYGKNVTSASNQKETQPHYYVGSFQELMGLVMAKEHRDGA